MYLLGGGLYLLPSLTNPNGPFDLFNKAHPFNHFDDLRTLRGCTVFSAKKECSGIRIFTKDPYQQRTLL